MCINAPVSITSFLVGVTSSLVLIYYGAPKFHLENMITGIFYIYISFMQLVEFFMWIDLDGKLGLNRIATIIAPIYVMLQPIVLYVLKAFITGRQNMLYNIAAITYTANEVFLYTEFIRDTKILLTRPKDGVLLWKWNSPNYSYFIMFAWAILLFFPLSYALMILIFGILSLWLSIYAYKSDFPTIWCLMNAYIPMFIYFAGFYL